ncbi:MAG: hypothetical protein QOJ39_444, partial [Candidatus Eremiobacteraeota bacterium]|nr:hypothetical protein [Candidatus Eremiobacteraeota bacterium]
MSALNEDRRLFEPRYDVSSAAHHLGMPRSTLNAWVKGQGAFKRVLDLDTPGFLSFVNLTEAFVLFAMRRHYRITMPRIRDAIDYVAREMRVTHPLAFQHFVTDKVDLFVRSALGDVNVSRQGQTRMTEVLADLERIEWHGQRPIALFPLLSLYGNNDRRPIRISPLVAFGRPVLTGTGVPTRAVWERFKGGESVLELAEDYGLPTEAIEEAVR